MSGIIRAIERAGDRTTFAAEIGVTVQAVCQWVKRGWVPPARAMQIEARYDIPRTDLIKPELLALFTKD